MAENIPKSSEIVSEPVQHQEPAPAKDLSLPIEEEKYEKLNMPALNLKFWKWDCFQTAEKYVYQNIFRPTNKAYNVIPKHMTDIKESYFIFAEQKYRMITLAATTIFLAYLLSRKYNSARVYLRNCITTYFGISWLMVPEVYNPYLS